MATSYELYMDETHDMRNEMLSDGAPSGFTEWVNDAPCELCQFTCDEESYEFRYGDVYDRYCYKIELLYNPSLPEKFTLTYGFLDGTKDLSELNMQELKKKTGENEYDILKSLCIGVMYDTLYNNMSDTTHNDYIEFVKTIQNKYDM